MPDITGVEKRAQSSRTLQDELSMNYIPDNVRKIHMIAACGTGMGALACMLQDLGFEVTGSDQNIYPPMSDFLMNKGVRLFKGFSGSNLDYDPDLVITGNAVSRPNPEAVAVMERKIPYCSMPQALNHFVARDKKVLIVTGTHGKTTTSSILAYLLDVAGLDPSFMIGGIVKGYQSNYRIGQGGFIVIEGDEYDTAFFDKGPKFMHYTPHAAVITSVEFDHADIFRDLDHIKTVFRKFISGIPENSLIMASGEDINIRDVISSASCDVIFYGKENSASGIHSAEKNPNRNRDENFSSGIECCSSSSYDLTCSDLRIEDGKTVFEISASSEERVTIRTPLMGRHNAMNILAVYGIAKRLGISEDAILKALISFPGVRRRQDIRGVRRGITVMDDFAHHPSAVRETIAAVKPFFTEGRLIAIFEPRTNSSMRSVFQDEYPASFDGADIVCIREPSMLSKIPESERISAGKLVKDIADRGMDAHLFRDTDSIIEFLNAEAGSGDLLLIMSNGGFDNIHERLLNLL